MNANKLLLLICCFITYSTSALADSDGIYCVTENHVAVEAKGIFIPAKEHSWIVITYSKSGLGEKEVIPVTSARAAKFNCSDIDKKIIKQGELAFIESSDVTTLLKTESGDYINLLSTFVRDSHVVDGAGPIKNYFSMSIVYETSFHQVLDIQLVASGMRSEIIH